MVNATNETNVSQKVYKQHCGQSRPEELRLNKIVSEIKKGSTPTSDDFKFLYKELNLSLRTAYGIYLSMCTEEKVSKVITWRTFYMQCSGYRVLKDNTIKALAKYALMCTGVKEAVIVNDTITL